MSSTNKTSYLDLSQFENTDKPSWLADYNSDMEKIDAGVRESRNQIGESNKEIEKINEQLTLGTTTAEYSDSNVYTVGDYVLHDGKLYKCIVDIPVPEPFDETHWELTAKGIYGRLSQDEADILALKTQCGNEVLDTTADTLSGAVNELKAGEDDHETRLDAVESTIGGYNSQINNIGRVAYQLAQPWSSAVAYKKNDIVLYENALYLFTGTDMITGHDFNIAEWQSIKMGDKVAELLKGQGVTVEADSVSFDSTAVSSVTTADNVQDALVDAITDNQRQWLIHGMLVTQQLTAGQTTITIADDRFHADSAVDIYTNKYGVNPTNATGTEGSITLTFEAQSEDVMVGILPKL